MDGFLEWFNSNDEIDSVLKAGIAHFWFVTIHPFENGNGRIARAIADMALARSEKSDQRFYIISAQIRRERNKYYDCLEEIQKGDLDITAQLALFLECLNRAFDHAEQTLSNVLRKAQFWERRAGQAFNERQRDMLNHLLDDFKGKLTSTKWAKMQKVSQDTAGRDIDDLLKRGILSKDAPGGRSTSYSLADDTDSLVLKLLEGRLGDGRSFGKAHMRIVPKNVMHFNDGFSAANNAFCQKYSAGSLVLPPLLAAQTLSGCTSFLLER